MLFSSVFTTHPDRQSNNKLQVAKDGSSPSIHCWAANQLACSINVLRSAKKKKIIVLRGTGSRRRTSHWTFAFVVRTFRIKYTSLYINYFKSFLSRTLIIKKGSLPFSFFFFLSFLSPHMIWTDPNIRTTLIGNIIILGDSLNRKASMGNHLLCANDDGILLFNDLMP